MIKTSISVLLGALLAAVLPLPSWSATLPTLPQSFVDTTYAAPTGNTITVNSGGNLQAAIDSAQLGDTIVLQAGATFPGPITLKKKTTGTGWIYIRTSAYASLPAPGTRVSPANVSSMATITGNGQLFPSAIVTEAGAHHYRFVGIEVKPVAGSFVFNLIEIGPAETSIANLPTDITFDRCYIHGDPTVGGRRGIVLNAVRGAVVDSYLSDFKEAGGDTQTILTWNTPGPIKIVNNYLEAAAENYNSGGSDPLIANLVPSDIEIRRNYFFKPLAWINQSWTVKNLIEFKNAQRVLVEGNVFENSWAAAQAGYAFLITPRNQQGTAPWSITQDITVRYNKFINVGQGFQISGSDDTFPSQLSKRILIEQNLVIVTGLQGADGRFFAIVRGPQDLTIRHNTGLINFNGGSTAVSDNTPKADQFDFRDNIFSNGSYGFFGRDTGNATDTLNLHYSNYTFQKNAIVGPYPFGVGTYPPGNFFPANVAAVGFVNAAGGNYRLSPVSVYKGAASDGRDVGANINAIEAAIAGTPIPTFALTVSKTGNGTGTVTTSPVGINCGGTCTASFNADDFVMLTPTPGGGSAFTGWSGGACTGTGPCYLTLAQATTVTATFSIPSTATPRLANISTRLPVLTGNNVLIGGFIIGGTSSKTVVVRARGPSLSAQGVPGVLANPLLTLYSGATVIASNDDWQVGPYTAAVQASGFAPSNPQESAIHISLTPGAYTAIVSGVSGTTGVGLIEVFEVDKPEVPLANISTRGPVLTGNNVLIGGFIIQGNSPQTVVVRARGPSLASSGLTSLLGNPVLQLFSGATQIAVNDDWQLAPNAGAIQMSGFAPSDPLESAILITLNPGAYTAIVTGAGGLTGIGIVEVFAQ